MIITCTPTSILMIAFFGFSDSKLALYNRLLVDCRSLAHPMGSWPAGSPHAHLIVGSQRPVRTTDRELDPRWRARSPSAPPAALLIPSRISSERAPRMHRVKKLPSRPHDPTHAWTDSVRSLARSWVAGSLVRSTSAARSHAQGPLARCQNRLAPPAG